MITTIAIKDEPYTIIAEDLTVLAVGKEMGEKTMSKINASPLRQLIMRGQALNDG